MDWWEAAGKSPEHGLQRGHKSGEIGDAGSQFMLGTGVGGAVTGLLEHPAGRVCGRMLSHLLAGSCISSHP